MSSDGDQDRDAMVRALDAHGRAFLESFSVTTRTPRGVKRKRVEGGSGEGTGLSGTLEAESDSEWEGFGGSGEPANEAESSTRQAKQGLSKRDAARGRVHSDPVVIDFSQTIVSGSVVAGRLRDNTFMSSKISKLRKASPDQKDAGSSAELDDEGLNSSNAKNDAELHRLVHTQLLSASLNPALGLTAAQKRKAISGRIMELTGTVKLGEGEKRVRRKEHNQAPQRIRDGIYTKRKEQDRKELEEAKQLGNYHHSIKHHFAASSHSAPARTKRRARGIGSGVGTFVGGTLKLNKREVEAVQSMSGSGDPSQGRRPRTSAKRRRS